jgi:hypothetical protein
MNITGVSMYIRLQMKCASRLAISFERRVAAFFGVISPKIRIRNVRIPVAIPAPKLPKAFIAILVAREEADKFTMLFPIRIAESILLFWSVMRSTKAARLSPAFARVFIFIRLTVVSAVSADEK